MTDIPKAVLEQLEMVRMQGHVNMLLKNGVQVAANELGCYELVCFIEETGPKEWMPVLNALGDFTNNMSTAKRDALRAAVDAASEDGWDD